MNHSGCYVVDGYSTSEVQPPADVQQDGRNVTCSQINNITVLSFSRKIDTGDPKDLPFTNDNITFQWAYSSGNDITVEHDSAGNDSVNLLLNLPVPPTPAPPIFGNSFVAANGGIRVAWLVAGSTIEFSVVANSTGYVGVGWALANGMPMFASTMVVGWVDDKTSTSHLYSLWSNANALPSMLRELGRLGFASQRS
jgi:hypothetical protein